MGATTRARGRAGAGPAGADLTVAAGYAHMVLNLVRHHHAAVIVVGSIAAGPRHAVLGRLPAHHQPHHTGRIAGRVQRIRALAHFDPVREAVVVRVGIARIGRARDFRAIRKPVLIGIRIQRIAAVDGYFVVVGEPIVVRVALQRIGAVAGLLTVEQFVVIRIEVGIDALADPVVVFAGFRNGALGIHQREHLDKGAGQPRARHVPEIAVRVGEPLAERSERERGQHRPIGGIGAQHQCVRRRGQGAHVAYREAQETLVRRKLLRPQIRDLVIRQHGADEGLIVAYVAVAIAALRQFRIDRLCDAIRGHGPGKGDHVAVARQKEAVRAEVAMRNPHTATQRSAEIDVPPHVARRQFADVAERGGPGDVAARRHDRRREHDILGKDGSINTRPVLEGRQRRHRPNVRCHVGVVEMHFHLVVGEHDRAIGGELAAVGALDRAVGQERHRLAPAVVRTVVVEEMRILEERRLDRIGPHDGNLSVRSGHQPEILRGGRLLDIPHQGGIGQLGRRARIDLAVLVPGDQQVAVAVEHHLRAGVLEVVAGAPGERAPNPAGVGRAIDFLVGVGRDVPIRINRHEELSHASVPGQGGAQHQTRVQGQHLRAQPLRAIVDGEVEGIHLAHDQRIRIKLAAVLLPRQHRRAVGGHAQLRRAIHQRIGGQVEGRPARSVVSRHRNLQRRQRLVQPGRRRKHVPGILPGGDRVSVGPQPDLRLAVARAVIPEQSLIHPVGSVPNVPVQRIGVLGDAVRAGILHPQQHAVRAAHVQRGLRIREAIGLHKQLARRRRQQFILLQGRILLQAVAPQHLVVQCAPALLDVEIIAAHQLEFLRLQVCNGPADRIDRRGTVVAGGVDVEIPPLAPNGGGPEQEIGADLGAQRQIQVVFERFDLEGVGQVQPDQPFDVRQARDAKAQRSPKARRDLDLRLAPLRIEVRVEVDRSENFQMRADFSVQRRLEGDVPRRGFLRHIHAHGEIATVVPRRPFVEILEVHPAAHNRHHVDALEIPFAAHRSPQFADPFQVHRARNVQREWILELVVAGPGRILSSGRLGRNRLARFFGEAYVRRQEIVRLAPRVGRGRRVARPQLGWRNHFHVGADRRRILLVVARGDHFQFAARTHSDGDRQQVLGGGRPRALLPVVDQPLHGAFARPLPIHRRKAGHFELATRAIEPPDAVEEGRRRAVVKVVRITPVQPADLQHARPHPVFGVQRHDIRLAHGVAVVVGGHQPHDRRVAVLPIPILVSQPDDMFIIARLDVWTHIARTGSEGHIEAGPAIGGNRQRNIQARVVGIAEVVMDVHVLARRPHRTLGHHQPGDDGVDVEIHVQTVVVVRHIRVGVRVQNAAVGSVHPGVGQAVVGAEHREGLVRTGTDRHIAIRGDRAQHRILGGLDVAIARRTANLDHVVRACGGADGQRRLVHAGGRGRRERDDDVGDRIVADGRRHSGNREVRRARPAECGLADGQVLGAQIQEPEGAGAGRTNRHDVLKVRALLHRDPLARKDDRAVGAQHIEFWPQENRHDDPVGKVVRVRGIRRLPPGFKSAADQQATLRIEGHRAHVLAGRVGSHPRPCGSIPTGHAGRPVRSGMRKTATREQRAFTVKGQRLDIGIPVRVADPAAQRAPSHMFIGPVGRIHVQGPDIGHQWFHAPRAGGPANARPVFRPEKQVALRIERKGIKRIRNAFSTSYRIPLTPLPVIKGNHADHLKGGIVVAVAAIETRKLGKISADVQKAIRGADPGGADRAADVVVQPHLPVPVVLGHGEDVERIAGGIESKDVVQVGVRQVAADIEATGRLIPRQRIHRARGKSHKLRDRRQDIVGGFVPVGSIPHGQRMRRPAARPVEATAHHQPALGIKRERIHHARRERAARIDLQARTQGLPAHTIPFRNAVGRRSADAGELAADIDHAIRRVGQNRVHHSPLR